MEFLAEYGLFFLKVLTFVVAAVVVIVVATASQQSEEGEGEIQVTSLNKALESSKHIMEASVLDKDVLKKRAKEEKKAAKKASKQKQKAAEEPTKKRAYVIEFEGDMRAKAAEQLRREVTAVLSVADKNDEVVIKLESPGGVVHGYGYAASQLRRIRDKDIPLTICVDKVAASGGYMMSCIGNKIISAPFAMIGSIGVVAQIPNFHKLLQKHDIDYEIHTAGEFKRTLTMFGENTDAGREKFGEELEQTHVLFKDFVAENRPQLDIETIATGEVWFGSQALERQLVDELGTSDEYLVTLAEEADVYSVKFKEKKNWQSRLGLSMESSLSNAIENTVANFWNNRFK